MKNIENKLFNSENEILIFRLNTAYKLIYKKYNSNQYQKVDRSVFVSYKFESKK